MSSNRVSQARKRSFEDWNICSQAYGGGRTEWGPGVQLSLQAVARGAGRRRAGVEDVVARGWRASAAASESGSGSERRPDLELVSYALDHRIGELGRAGMATEIRS